MIHYGQSIGSRADAKGVTTWLWADHDGLHCGPDLPTAEVVPTGHLWGWGHGVRVHLREDASVPTRGILVRETAYAGQELITLTLKRTSGLPAIVCDRDRFLRCASPADQHRLDALNLDVLVVTAPTRALLVADRKV